MNRPDPICPNPAHAGPAAGPSGFAGLLWLARLPQRAGLLLIAGYRRGVSPFLAPRCRFFPSCSEYAHDAVSRHGLLRGVWLAARRLLRCHPFHPGGHDPVR